MLSLAPKAIEELGFFNDEGVWGQEEEERRGTGVRGLHSVPLLWSLCLQHVLQSRMWKAAGRRIREQQAFDASGRGADNEMQGCARA